MLELRRLRLLRELDRRGTIAAVAEALHFSASGVSQQLSQLENEVGVTLLERVGRGVRLTDAARRLVEHTDAAIRVLEQAEADMSTFQRRPAGIVRVAAFQTAALALVPPMLDALSEHDALRIETTQVEPEQAVPALVARDFDVVISEEYPHVSSGLSDEVDQVEVCIDALELAMPQGADGTGSGHLEQAANMVWVMEPRGSMAREWAVNMCRSAGFEPDVQFESSDMLVHRELVRRGHAAAFLPRLLAQAMPADMPTTAPLGQHRRIFTLVRQGSQHRLSIKAVREALSGAATDLQRR
jgi:DNA-binding transcriptional LysR family regulator